jgi:tRNA (guanine-N7-)-methyltransferase
MYDPRYVDHRADEIAAFEALRERLLVEGMPSVLEIGSNRGDFLSGQAVRVSPQPVLGIEWRAKQCALAVERLAERGIDNAHVLHGDAKLAVPSIFDAESLDAIFVLFPDPWWKSRHAHRRLLDPMFLRVLARRLRPKGALYVKSDVFEYLYQVRAAAQVSEALRPLPADRWPDERTWSLSTRERKCMQGAIPFGRGYYTRLPKFEPSLPLTPESPDAFAVPDTVDPTSVIKGAPPVDQSSGGRRR